MKTLQVKVGKEDAELLVRALRHYDKYWNDAPIPHRAVWLADWLDHRIAKFWPGGNDDPDELRQVISLLRDRLAAAEAENGEP